MVSVGIAGWPAGELGSALAVGDTGSVGDVAAAVGASVPRISTC